ncbi:hypothetical protein BH10CYA1_BH10CYA1_64360 [soil metagenome]
MELLIGNALIRWNFITQRELEAGLSLASLTNLPLGKSLCALNLLSEGDLRTSVQVQSMLRDAILSELEADRVMHLCRVKKLSLSRALSMTGLISLSGQRIRLGQLLIDYGYLNQDELTKALQICQRTGLPLGAVLTSCDLVDASVVDTVLRYQKVQRLTRSSGDLQTLKTEIERIPKNIRIQVEADTRLGSILQAGKIISTTELMAALEISFANQKLLGELLVELNWIKQATLEAALELQKAIRQGQTDVKHAVQILRQVHVRRSTLQDVLEKRLSSFTRDLPFEKFLTISGLVATEQLQTVKNEYAKPAANISTNLISNKICGDAQCVKDAICKAGISAQSTMNEAIEYWQSVRQGLIPIVRAIALLSNFVINNEPMNSTRQIVMQN